MTFRTLLSALILLAGINLSSCNQCIGPFGKEKVVCDNGGTCNDGECDCLKGYSGPNCSVVNVCELNDVECGEGVCEEGECICNVGYEGEDCTIESRAQFIGTWDVVERCPDLDTVGNLTMTIERDLLDDSRMDFSKVFSFANWPINGFFSDVSAIATPGTMSFTIPNQAPDDNGKTISGSGTMTVVDENNKSIEIEFTVVNGGQTFTCMLEAEFVPTP